MKMKKMMLASRFPSAAPRREEQILPFRVSPQIGPMRCRGIAGPASKRGAT
ncbi:hypothetical protein ACRQ5Q_26685 [Bradyrhizobium sp. PMVTL-01]|uniref:hypothetical protein n=1 Tax=unclassified Bradyrhizobium TaxID=2631580 RepID=UPI003F71A554